MALVVVLKLGERDTRSLKVRFGNVFVSKRMRFLCREATISLTAFGVWT